MSSVLRVFIKDARRNWPLLAGWWAVMAGFFWLDARGSRAVSGLNLAVILTMLSLASLIVWVIHEDELTGDRQYWLTRPISWRALLGAKLLFVAVFGNLAILLAQAAAFGANGIPLGAYAGGFLSRQLFLTSCLILPVAALASVTRNGKQALVAVLGAYATAFFLMAVHMRFLVPTSFDFGSGHWVVVIVEASVAGLIALSVLLLQYSRRSTLVARIVLASGPPHLVWIPQVLPWGAVHPLALRFSPFVDKQVGRLELQPKRPNHSHSVINEIHVPMKAAGLPDGSQAVAEWASAWIEAPDGAVWDSGWSPTSHLGQFEPNDAPVMWAVVVDDPFFARYRHTPVHLKVTVALVLLGPVHSTHLPDAGVPNPAPGDGSCLWIKGSSSIQSSCVKPFNRTVYFAFRYKAAQGREFVQPISSARVPGPYATSSSFSMWEGTPTFNFLPLPPAGHFELYLDSREVFGSFDRVLDLPSVLLAEDL